MNKLNLVLGAFLIFNTTLCVYVSLYFPSTYNNIYVYVESEPEPQQEPPAPITQAHDFKKDLKAALQSTNADYLPKAKGKVLDLWQGGKQIPYEDLYSTILHVVNKAPFDIKDKKGTISLIAEIIATESFGGSVTKQVKGPALGIGQMEPASISCLNKNYLVAYKDLTNFLSSFRNKKLSEKDNIKYNVKYHIAYMLCFLHRKNIHNQSLHNTQVRALTHKIYYNTPLGKSTVSKYISDKTTYLGV